MVTGHSSDPLCALFHLWPLNSKLTVRCEGERRVGNSHSGFCQETDTSQQPHVSGVTRAYSANTPLCSVCVWLSPPPCTLGPGRLLIPSCTLIYEQTKPSHQARQGDTVKCLSLSFFVCTVTRFDGSMDWRIIIIIIPAPSTIWPPSLHPSLEGSKCVTYGPYYAFDTPLPAA